MIKFKRQKFLNHLILTLVGSALFLVFIFTENRTTIAAQKVSKPEIPSLTKEKILSAEKTEPEALPEVSLEEEKLLSFSGTISKKPVYSELRSHGLQASEILTLSKSFKKVFDFKNARPRDEYTLYLTEDNQLQRFEYKTGLFNFYTAEKGEDGGFNVSRTEIVPETEVLGKEFSINSSLYNAMIGAGERQQLVQSFADIFSWDIDFYLYPRKGDKIKILFEKQTIDGNFVGYGKILAAQYIGKNKTFSAFLFNDGKFSSYYDEEGRPLRKMFLRIPVKFGVRTSNYSIRRFHPVTKKYKPHTGIDYGAPTGTPIFATGNGKVVYSGWKNGYGKVIILQHPNGYKTYYAHCSKLISKKGDYVDQGQTIAKVGSTGRVTGPHVHYEVRIKNRPVNPNTIKTSKGKAIRKDLMSDYTAMVRDRLLQVETTLESAEQPVVTASSSSSSKQ